MKSQCASHRNSRSIKNISAAVLHRDITTYRKSQDILLERRVAGGGLRHGRSYTIRDAILVLMGTGGLINSVVQQVDSTSNTEKCIDGQHRP